MALTDPSAVRLIDEVVQGNKRLLLGVVKPLGGAEPPEGAVMHARADELYEVGTLSTVVRMLKLGDGSVRVMVQGLERARLGEITPAEHWLVAAYETFSDAQPEDARTGARPQAWPRRPPRWRSASSSGCGKGRPSRRRTTSRAPTSKCSRPCRGAAPRTTGST